MYHYSQSELKKKRSLLQMDELKCRKRVLRRLGYANASDAIELKGRVACEISAADELLLTELLFNGVFNDLEVAQVNLFYTFANQSEGQDMTTTQKGKTLVSTLKVCRFCQTDSLYIGRLALPSPNMAIFLSKAYSFTVMLALYKKSQYGLKTRGQIVSQILHFNSSKHLPSLSGPLLSVESLANQF